MLGLLKQDVQTIWNPDRFRMDRPIHAVGHIADKSGFCRPLPRVLDMPVKLAGGPLRLPPVFNAHSGVHEFLKIAFHVEDEILPDWRETHNVYLTVDQKKVAPGQTQRQPGWHFDGMQGARYPVKLRACHSYLASSSLATEFAVQSFDASQLDECKDNWFDALGRQVNPHSIQISNSFDVLALSAYVIHRAVVAGQEVTRSFMRLDVTEKIFDRQGNTLNPWINTAHWDYQPRPIPVFE